jgi:hypothetical protein
MPISESWIDVDWPEGRASYRATNIRIDDYGDIFNAIVDGDSIDSEASFVIKWTGVQQRVTVDASNNRAFGGSDWGGHFAVMDATAEWRMSQPGFHFKTDPATTSEPVFAFLGEERNGTFFH